jgi:hypothetical protein
VVDCRFVSSCHPSLYFTPPRWLPWRRLGSRVEGFLLALKLALIHISSTPEI